MSTEKMKRYKEEKKNRKPGTNRYTDEARSLKRDTICALLVLAVLILAPIGITVSENHKAAVQAQQNEEMMKAIQEALASASQAQSAESTETLEGTETSESIEASESSETSEGTEAAETEAAETEGMEDGTTAAAE